MMLHTFLADDVARAKIQEGVRRAERSAEVARATVETSTAGPSASDPKRGLRAAVGRRLVRAGLRLSGADLSAFTQPAPADPCL